MLQQAMSAVQAVRAFGVTGLGFGVDGGPGLATGGVAGAFIGLHAAGNLSGGIGDYADIFDGKDRDWNFTKIGYENLFEAAGQDRSNGTKAFHLTDAALGVGAALTPVKADVALSVNVGGNSVLSLEGTATKAAITQSSRPVIVHDAVQLQQSLQSGVGD